MRRNQFPAANSAADFSARDRKAPRISDSAAQSAEGTGISTAGEGRLRCCASLKSKPMRQSSVIIRNQLLRSLGRQPILKLEGEEKMTKLQSLIVGSHFRPPAKLILANLPAGAHLMLEPDPENPYDSFALKVLVSPAEIPKSQYKEMGDSLLEFGTSLEDVLLGPPVFLGFVAASGGKPLANAGLTVGNREFLADLISGGEMQSYLATLGFTPGGLPMINCEVS